MSGDTARLRTAVNVMIHGRIAAPTPQISPIRARYMQHLTPFFTHTTLYSVALSKDPRQGWSGRGMLREKHSIRAIVHVGTFQGGLNPSRSLVCLKIKSGSLVSGSSFGVRLV